MSELHIEEEKWKDIRKDFKKVEPNLAEIIDDLDPGSEYTLFRVRYPFGETIIKNGNFHLPIHNYGAISIKDGRVPAKIREKLDYTGGTIPLGIVLSQEAELFMQSKQRLIPFKLLTPGRIFSLWRVLDPGHSYFVVRAWSMTAGARFMFMLPKITDTSGHKKLKRTYGIRSEPPRNLLDHWTIFKEISRHHNFPYQAYTEMMFFSAKWLEKRNDSHWLKFYNYLLQYAWNDTQYWRNKIVFDLVWDSFVSHLAEENFRPNAHTIDVVKHLILVGTGVSPGFSPVTNCDFIKVIQEIYIETYGLKNYAPVIMKSSHFSMPKNEPVYYSFQLQTQFESSPKPKSPTTVLSDMRDIKVIMDKFLLEVSQGNLKEFVDTLIQDFAKKIKYDFWHSELDLSGHIRSVKELPREDKRLVFIPNRENWPRALAETSPFLRGCVKISSVI